jgi:hypothetical protein
MNIVRSPDAFLAIDAANIGRKRQLGTGSGGHNPAIPDDDGFTATRVAGALFPSRPGQPMLP